MPFMGLHSYQRSFLPPYPLYQQPLHSLNTIDLACFAKYEPAWGHHEYDRLKSQSVFKSGELPPATPDTSLMFKEGFLGGRNLRNPMYYPHDKMSN